MQTLTLTRFESSDHGTFGILTTEDDEQVCYTLELPWRENRNIYSCIKLGEYVCVYTMSNRFRKNLYLLLQVEGRAGVRIHAGNLAGDILKGFRTHSEGCILLGETRGKLDGQKAVFTSNPMIDKLYRITNKEPFKLVIKEK